MPHKKTNVLSQPIPNEKKKQENQKQNKTKKLQQQLQKTKKKKTKKPPKKQTTTTTAKKAKASIVAPELVTLHCSLTHVLQAPNTQPYHSCHSL